VEDAVVVNWKDKESKKLKSVPVICKTGASVQNNKAYFQYLFQE
jgi:hypothetical protein